MQRILTTLVLLAGLSAFPAMAQEQSRGQRGNAVAGALLPMTRRGQSGFIDVAGKMAFALGKDASSIGEFSEGLVPVRVGWKAGFMDRTGKTVIEPQFVYAHSFHDGRALVTVDAPEGGEGVRYGFIDHAGKLVIEAKYDDARDFDGGVAVVELDGRKHLIDRDGRRVGKLDFDDVSDFHEGLARAMILDDGLEWWGYISRKGEWVVEPKYPYAMDFSDGRGRVFLTDPWIVQDDSVGYVDAEGNLLFAGTYARDFHEGKAAFMEPGDPPKEGFMDQTGKTVIAPRFAEVGRFSGGLAPARVKDKYGYIDAEGRFVIEPQFDAAKPFDGDVAAVGMKRRENSRGRPVFLWGLIDQQGEWLHRPHFDEIDDFVDDMAKVRRGRRTGFIDRDGRVVVALDYEGTSDFSEGLAEVYTLSLKGYVDPEGKWIIPPRFDRVRWFHQGRAAVEVEGRWGFIDEMGKQVVPCVYDAAADFSEGLAAVERSEGWSFIDKSGKTVIDGLATVRAGVFERFEDGLAEVRFKDGPWVFINRKGQIVPPSQRIRDILVPVERGGKYGFARYLDVRDEEDAAELVIPARYDYARYFSEGLAAVAVDGKWGFIDGTGKTAIPARFDGAGSFREGRAVAGVRTGTDEEGEPVGRYGIIDRDGEWVVQPRYEVIGASLPCVYSEGLIPVRVDGKWGYINRDGKMVIPPKFMRADDFVDGFALIILDSRRGWVGKDGKVVLEEK